jgi:Ras-related protein Rab-5C
MTDHGNISLNIWDTAGQERYKSLVPMYCRSAVALIVVHDLGSSNSFAESKEWCSRFRNPDCDVIQDIYYVGNKRDLPVLEVREDEVRQYAESIGARYFGTSAKTGEGIQELFQAIADAVASRRQTAAEEIVRLEKRPAEEEGSCC